MKYFLIILICIYIPIVNADELDNISIINPISYSRTKVTSQDLESKAEIWFGNIIGATDIAPKLKESIAPYRKELAPYFTRPGELDQLLATLTEEANRTIVKDKLTDARAIEVTHFLGNHLIGAIADKILENQGVTSTERRNLWVTKILDPFNRCIEKASNALFAADHCMTALTTSLVPSAGVGIVYELSRANLSASMPEKKQIEFNVNQANQYIICMNTLFKTAESVKLCSLQTMKSGMIKVSEASLNDTINSTATSKSEAVTIKNKVWPSYTQCIQTVGTEDGNKNYTTQFLNCVDNLVQSTGTLLVADKIRNTPSIKEQFSNVDIEKLATEKADQFRACTNKLIAENKRVNGMIDSNTCKEIVTNDVTYQVILKNFKKNADKQFMQKNAEAELTFNAGKSALDKCWGKNINNNDREKCTRSAIITFTLQAANFKLDKAIPGDIQSKDRLKNTSIENFKKCLDKKLPINISESNNTAPVISACSDVLTREVALTVAEEEVRLSVRDSMSPEETNHTVDQLVKDQFAKCLSPQLSDTNLDNCSNKLQTVVAEKLVIQNINQNIVDRTNMPLASTREALKNEIMDNFKLCLNNSPNKEACAEELKKEADRKIVLAVGKIETSTQLNTDITPEKIFAVQNTFTECTKTKLTGEELTKKLDECNKNFSIDFARNLGLLKLDYSLGNALGKTTLKEQQVQYDKIITEYNHCLDGLYKYKMADHLTDKIGICTSELEAKALSMVRSNLNTWMTTSEKDARSLAVKNEFSTIIPCLSSLLPTSPYTPSMQSNVDSALKPVALLLAQYIEYSPENAKSNLNDIIAKLSENIKTNGGTEKAKSEIIDLLYQNGALDQFIKAMVRGKVKDAFSTLSDKDLPKSVRDQLISKENFDSIFDSAEGNSIKNFVLDNMLKPVLLKGADLTSPQMTESFSQVNSKVVKMLVGSPRFGDIIIRSGVQQQIDSMGGLTRVFAKVVYGNDSLNWEKVRLTEAGKKAEEYIRQHVLLPKFQENTNNPEDDKKISAEAENLVKEAVTKYSESKK